MKKINLLIFCLAAQLSFCVPGFAQKQFKALLVTTTRGWHHKSQHYGVVALEQMALQQYFDLVVFEDPNTFNDEYLKQFQVVIFLCTTGDVFNEQQQLTLERFIQAGKGFVGIHSASDTEYGWEWYTKLVGRMFYIHPEIQTAKMQVLDNNFPGLQGFANGKLFTEEFYQFQPELVKDLHYILGVDETTYNPKVQWKDKKGDGMGSFHPLAWYHDYDGGRSFYTALGHVTTDYIDKSFLDHLYAGIRWAATGKK